MGGEHTLKKVLLAAFVALACLPAGARSFPAVRSPAPENVSIEGHLGERHRKNVGYLLYLLHGIHPWREKLRVDKDGLYAKEIRRRESLGEKIARMSGREFMLDAFERRSGPHVRLWDGEYAGKWLDAAALTVANTGEDRLGRDLRAFLRDLAKYQREDGYFGITAKPRGTAWGMWNHWYILTGMLSAYEYCGWRRGMEVARGVGDWIADTYLPEKNRPRLLRGAWQGGCTIDVLGQLMRLHRHTGNPAYLRLGDYISQNYTPIREMRETGQPVYTHAYVLCAYMGGLVEYDLSRGERTNLAWIERVWEHLAREQVYPSGGLGRGERLQKPKPDRPAVYDKDGGKLQETCATVEWMILNHRLYRATGKVRYAHMIERTIYNALLAAQSEGGQKWTYFTPLSATESGKRWFHGATMCCFWSGPRGVARIPLCAYHMDSDGVRVDLYEKGSATFSRNGEKVTLRQKTSYPARGQVQIVVETDDDVEFSLKLRIPVWADDVSVSVNSNLVSEASTAGEYSTIHRTWMSGDEVFLKMHMPVRLRRMRGGNVTIHRGPELLSADERDNPVVDLKSIRIPEAGIELTPVASADGRRRYSAEMLVDGRVKEVILTPFAAAGNKGAGYRSSFPAPRSLDTIKTRTYLSRDRKADL